MDELLTKVKANLILEHTADDTLLKSYITAAVSYAESYQHIPEGFYKESHASHHRASRHYAVVPLLRKPGRQHGRLLCG